MPDQIVAIARHPGGPGLSTADLRRAGEPGTPYTGKLSIPETGDVEIAIKIPAAGGGEYEVPGSAIERTVIEGGRQTVRGARRGRVGARSAGAGEPAARRRRRAGSRRSSGSSGSAAVVVVLLLVARRVLADL